jgi:uncharacterized membrane protein YphA (DoxX/SURF4 family)
MELRRQGHLRQAGRQTAAQLRDASFDLGIRLYIAKVFFLSGLTKIRDWETTVVSYGHFLISAEPALARHVYWGVLILVVLLHGPGQLSLDAIVWKKMNQA